MNHPDSQMSGNIDPLETTVDVAASRSTISAKRPSASTVFLLALAAVALYFCYLIASPFRSPIFSAVMIAPDDIELVNGTSELRRKWIDSILGQVDREYLEKTAAALRAEGFTVSTELALGDPPGEILKAAEAKNCDLIAMAGHGHRFFGDLFHGSTITKVRHFANIPLLVIRAQKK